MDTVIIFYVDKYGRRQEWVCNVDEFEYYAIALLEILDNRHDLKYTIGNTTKDLDYYNIERLHAKTRRIHFNTHRTV